MRVDTVTSTGTVIFIVLCLSTYATANVIVDLAAILPNGSFERDDMQPVNWTATKKSNNFQLDAPSVDPIIVPLGDSGPLPALQAPEGSNFIGVVNEGDDDLAGRLVHDIVPGFFRKGTIFVITVFGNHGRIEPASTHLFPSRYCCPDVHGSELNLQFLGWGPGSVPVIVDLNDETWNRRPLVNIFATFNEHWDSTNGQWSSRIFEFPLDQDVQYITLGLTGNNHNPRSFVAFDVSVTVPEPTMMLFYMIAFLARLWSRPRASLYGAVPRRVGLRR